MDHKCSFKIHPKPKKNNARTVSFKCTVCALIVHVKTAPLRALLTGRARNHRLKQRWIGGRQYDTEDLNFIEREREAFEFLFGYESNHQFTT